MTDTDEDFFAHLLSDMGELIEKRRADMSPAELDRAIATIATVASTCGRAAALCHQMNYTDAQTQEFIGAVLKAFIEDARQAIAPGKVH